MKKLLLSILLAIAFLTCQARAETLETAIDKQLSSKGERFIFSTNVNFGYDYDFGYSKIDQGKVQKDKSNNIILDDRFRNTVYIENILLNSKARLTELLEVNLSGEIISNGLSSEPLYNIDNYKNFNNFLTDRKNNLKNIWYRTGIIQDVNFALKDSTIDGSMIIGQQVIPFGYTGTSTDRKVSKFPSITTMTEYINFNLKGLEDTPYQNSTMSDVRDIGVTLSGNYTGFKFASGIYNGTGPNMLDNNNEKDYFFRLDYLARFFELGASHLRGKHIGYKNALSATPERKDFEMYKSGVHSKIGNEDFYIAGEFILNQEKWNDNTSTDQYGWYIESFLNLKNLLSANVRYESFFDTNVLKNKSNASYNLKRFSASLYQSVYPNVRLKQEYTHNWEDLTNGSDKTFSNYGLVSITTQMTF
jgi:hypothetical protein